ncbi:7881_t:CDS:2 [Scutellospora calospora]|uniref:7881_t:CDS:1 n=1 Tax=Scutellospora calospora TaxID=85575 RepID=A0ACA9KSP4_9GLOM|nr:7881_t:CDS:2 [Scutellospora calospora]
MGPPHPIWNYFDKLGHVTGFQQPRAKCSECNYEFNEATKPAVKHFKKCQLVSNDKRKEYAELENVYKANKKLDTNLESTLSTTASSSRISKQSMLSFVDRITPQEQKALELKFASSIYQCGLVLSLSELQPIIDLWKQARPAFKLPSRRRLSSSLLDKVYNEIKKEMQFYISNCNNLCLVSDSCPTGETRQTGEVIAENLQKVINQVGVRKIACVITDNTSVMKKAWNILKRNNPQILFLGCIAHNLNLLIGDILKLKWATNTLMSSKKLVYYFKKHQIPGAILKRYQKSSYTRYNTLKYPAQTRWGSSAACLNSILKNQLALELAKTELSRATNIDFPKIIANTINSSNYWNSVKNLLFILDRLVVGISIFENYIQNDDDDTISDSIRNILKKRWKKTYNPVILVAYLLDPRYHGQDLPKNSNSIISKFVQEYYPQNATKIWSSITEYKTKSGVFNQELAWKTVYQVEPIAWWEANFLSTALYLAKMAIRILSIPSSSAASERNWSAFAHIQNKKRNRLTSEWLSKLVYIYCNYHLNLPYLESANTIASRTRVESYSFDEINESEIGIWEDSDFDSNNESNNTSNNDTQESSNEYNTQESNDEEISSSDAEDFSD